MYFRIPQKPPAVIIQATHKFPSRSPCPPTPGTLQHTYSQDRHEIHKSWHDKKAQNQNRKRKTKTLGVERPVVNVGHSRPNPEMGVCVRQGPALVVVDDALVTRQLRVYVQAVPLTGQHHDWGVNAELRQLVHAGRIRSLVYLWCSKHKKEVGLEQQRMSARTTILP